MGQSARPARTPIAIATGRTIHGAGNGVENPLLNAGPDVLDESANSFDLLRIGSDGSKFYVWLLRFGDDGKLQPDRFVGKLTHQFVVHDQLPFSRVDITR